MPPAGILGDERRIAILGVLVGCTPAGADHVDDGAAVLHTYCARCHGASKAEGDLEFITDTNRLVAAPACRSTTA